MAKKYSPFRFKQFEIEHNQSAMKVGTDGVLLGAWTNPPLEGRILDIGTGTGLIAIMQAQKSNCHITAIDIDKSATEEARNNVSKSPWPNQITVLDQDMESLKSEYKFDLLISNPPFFKAENKITNTSRAAARQSNFLGLPTLLKALKTFGTETSKLSVILPAIEKTEVLNHISEEGLFLEKLTTVYPKVNTPAERILLLISRTKQKPLENRLIIQHEERNDFTDQYIEITRDFYLNL